MIRVAVPSPQDDYSETYLRGVISEWKAISLGSSSAARAAVADYLRVEIHGELSRWIVATKSLSSSPFGKYVGSGGDVEQLLGFDLLDIKLRV